MRIDGTYRFLKWSITLLISGAANPAIVLRVLRVMAPLASTSEYSEESAAGAARAGPAAAAATTRAMMVEERMMTG